jgi:hypothetical protein
MRLFAAVCYVAFIVVACTCAATTKAGKRRAVESYAANCIRNSHCTPQEVLQCYWQAEQICREIGMERLCGEGGPLTECKP